MITRMTNDVTQAQNGVNLVLRLFLRSPFIVLGATVMAFTIDVRCALIFVVVIAALSLVVFGIMGLTMPGYKNVQRQLDGVTLTGIGYVDGWLHVQVYYADILKTDNHGSISLVNRETGEQIECDGSAAFFDDAGTGSYEDYVFTGIEADALDTYALYGMFVTSAGPVGGNWSVTFPLENTAGN